MTQKTAVHTFTPTDRQAAIDASKVPSVRQAARHLGSIADDVEIDSATVIAAHQKLVDAVVDALADTKSAALDEMSDFAVQTALFAEGVPIFLAPPKLGLAEWISSMPDEAIDGLRNSMVETARAMGNSDAIASLLDAPKESFVSALADSAPNSSSGIIVDSDTITDIASEDGSLAPLGQAAKVLVGDSADNHLYDITCLAARNLGLCRRLRKFSFPAIATLLSDLLIRPENQTATVRIEALLHLAATACRGVKKPKLQQLRGWFCEINDDPVAKFEIPVEDVFVTNVGATFGNARLFQGNWENSGDYVRSCIQGLFAVGKEHRWAVESLKNIMALLRLSEALTERTGLKRYTYTENISKEIPKLDDSTWKELSRNVVVFNEEDLALIEVDPDDLHPFVLQNEHLRSLEGQVMGRSALERFPLVQRKGFTIVALPTAIGAAIRNFSIEQAIAAGDLQEFQLKLHLTQFTEAFQSGRPSWNVEFIEMPRPDQNDSMREFIGKFDEGGYFHLIFVPDDFKVASENGIRSFRPIEEPVRRRMQNRATALAEKNDYKRGLTVIVHGGIGRRISQTLEDLPDYPFGWLRLCVSVPDFILLGSMPDFTALRAWKLLQQVSDLKERGIFLSNLRGFINLVAFAYGVNFELAPKDMSEGMVYLPSNLLLPLRHKARIVLDHHYAKSPYGDSWFSIQRQPADYRLDEIEGRKEYYSIIHMIEGKVMACIESTSRPWWISIDGAVPEKQWTRDISFNILRTALSWLARLVPTLEERYTMLPSGPIAFRLRFPQIKEFSQHDIDPNRTAEAPSVEVREGTVVINCHPSYLQSFLAPGNLGDRLMIVAIARGLEALCNSEPVLDSKMNEWVQTVAGSENRHFLKMRISTTPSDIIYDAINLPRLRWPMPEDVAWSHLGLARLAGYESESDQISSGRAVDLLNQSVAVIWKRIEQRLARLSRESTVERALLNFISARQEHRNWMLAMAPRLAVYNPIQVEQVSIKRVFWRDITSLVSRVITEMAVCKSPYDSGSVCTNIDLDFLIAEVYTLVQCANYSDALHRELTDWVPVVLPNGTFEFDEFPLHMSTPMIEEYWHRQFRDVVERRSKEEEIPSQEFQQAFAAEFGLSLEQYRKFVQKVTTEAVNTGLALVKLRKYEVLQWFQCVGVMDALRTFDALALYPRDQWDESHPASAKARDWYPWKFNRRLSVLRRPIIQLSCSNDASVILAPSMLADTLGYLGMAEVGGRPETIFESEEMIAYVGSAADWHGHEFTKKVENRLRELDWITKRELRLTQLGGSDYLGDVDVLCWNVSSGLIYVIECKSLRFDSTWGEIGQRWAEYAADTNGKDRTPLQKHLDRMYFFETNPQILTNFTGIPVHKMKLRSALVTENISSLQFGGVARKKLDVVTDYELIEEMFNKR